MPITRRQALSLLGAAAASSAFPAPALASPEHSQGERTSGMALINRNVPATGEALPVIGLGTWQTFDVGPSEAERAPLREVLAAFVEAGGRVIDSSPMYGASEAVVGDLTSALKVRNRLFVATKVWTTGRQAGIGQMEDSMRKLRVERPDLMQVHNLVDVNTHLDTLRGWKREGRVRYLGVTHYTASAHDAVARVIEKAPLDFVQINYSVAERDAERRLLPLARDRGVAVIANRPFAGGGLIASLRGRPLPAWAGEIDCTSWAQLLLKFVVGNAAITCAIPGTSKVTHLRDNLRAGTGPLPDDRLRERIAAAVRQA